MDRVGRMYAAYQSARADKLPYKAGGEVEALLGKPWASFDDLYVGIYGLNLASDRSIGRDFGPPSTDLVPLRKLQILVDFDFPKIELGMPFEDTLLNEYRVSDLMMLGGSVESLVPYPLAVTSVRLGCLIVEYTVFGLPMERSEDIDLLVISDKHVERSGIWQNLQRRLPIAIQITPPG